MKAVAFDFGNTLVCSGLPLNWQEFYHTALLAVLRDMGLSVDPDRILAGEKVLLKYNTRVNNREYEVSADTIFSELFQEWGIADFTRLNRAEDTLLSFFLASTETYPDTEPVLKELKKKNMKIGVLTDTAYGADKKYLISGASDIVQYIDYFLASTDVGFRKPNTRGYFQLAKELGVDVTECMFVRDEEKDIIGANQAGMISVLLDRKNQYQNYGQRFTIHSLQEILKLVQDNS